MTNEELVALIQSGERDKLEAPMAAFRDKPSVETAKRCMELLYGVTIAWKEDA